MSEVDQHATPSPAAPARGQIHRTCEAALDYLSGAVVKMIPVLLVCGMLKTAQTLIGPSMLGLVGKADDLYALLGMVYDAGFYFMPIYLGYSCAEKLGGTPVLGSLLGGIMTVPAFAQLVGGNATFSVYGIPCTPVDYSRTVLPIVMSAALLAVLEVRLRKALPKVLAPMFAPLLAMAITLPASLCALGPLGSWCGNALGSALFSLGDRGGLVTVLGVGIIAASWEFLVIAGMRSLLLALGLANMLAVGTDSFVLVGPRLQSGLHLAWRSAASCGSVVQRREGRPWATLSRALWEALPSPRFTVWAFATAGHSSALPWEGSSAESGRVPRT